MSSHTSSSLFVDYTLHPDAILEAAYKENIPMITKEMAVIVVDDRLSLQRGAPCRLLLHWETAHGISPSARKYLSNEGSEGIAACAILVTNWTYRFVIKFLLSIKRPVFPTDVFSDRQKALEWLKKQDIGPSTLGADLVTYGLKRYDHAIEHDAYPKLTYDHNKRINKVNFAFCRLVGYNESELLGKPYSKLTRGGEGLYDKMGRPLQVELKISQFPEGRDGLSDSYVCPVYIEHTKPKPRIDAAKLGITSKDIILVKHLSTGLTVKQASEIMGIPARTLEGRILYLRKKMGAVNALHLLQMFNDLGLMGE